MSHYRLIQVDISMELKYLWEQHDQSKIREWFYNGMLKNLLYYHHCKIQLGKCSLLIFLNLLDSRNLLCNLMMKELDH